MNEPFPIYNLTQFGPDAFQALIAQIPRHGALSEVLKWAAQLSPARKPLQSLALDEFTHDVVIDYSKDVFLVYDVT